jgi:hypothetical protein
VFAASNKVAGDFWASPFERKGKNNSRKKSFSAGPVELKTKVELLLALHRASPGPCLEGNNSV